MKNITSWAAASAAIAIIGACTVEVKDGDVDGGATSSSSATGGSAGASSSSTTATGTGGTTGGSGGSSGDGGMMCSASSVSSTAGACEKCSFSDCTDETCACKGNTECNGAIGAFWTCLSTMGNDLAGCATTFATNANGGNMMGGGLANELASCMGDACEDLCKGLDASALPKRR